MRCAALPALLMAAPLPVGPLPYGVVAAAGRDVRAAARTYHPRQPLPRPQRPPPKGAAVRLDARPDGRAVRRDVRLDARPVAARSAVAAPY